MRVGKALNTIPSVASYGADGALSGEHVDAIVKGPGHIERRNPDLPDADRSDCVRGLLTEALIARDHGCAFPGCGCPVGYTDARHIDFWRNGGTTELRSHARRTLTTELAAA